MIDEELDLPEGSENDDEQEFYEHVRIEVDKGQSMLRIDKFLFDRLTNASRNKIQNAARAGSILVNGKAVKPNYKVKPLDSISIVLAHPPREVEIIPENIPVNIAYEDDDVMVINKNAGMVVHPGYGNYTGTLVNALTYHLQNNQGQTRRSAPTNPQPSNLKPYLVHRIDKNTSGLILVAKNEYAQTFLAKQFFDHSVDRQYLALVWGDFKEDEGTIVGHVGRSLKDRKVMTVFPDGDYGKHAVTHYKVVERFGYVTLVSCILETGRTHQIRAHMKHLGHPLFNDATYGGDQILKGTTFSKYKQFIQNCFKIMPRHALHAKTIGFEHPTTEKRVFFESELAEDMQAVIEKWRVYSSFKQLEEEED